MSQPKLLLHMGSHKTGSTALQTALRADRARLAEAGVVYPSLRPEIGGSPLGHNSLAHVLARPNMLNRLRLALAFRRMRRQAGARWTVLSAEAFWRHADPAPDAAPPGAARFLAGHGAYLRRLRRGLDGFDIVPLVYLRRPDSQLVSRYKEGVARGRITHEFAEFAGASPWHFHYPDRLTLYREIFGSVEARRFEAEAKAGLIAGFYHRFGIAPPQAQPPLRPSISNRAALWLARAQSETPRRRVPHSFRVIYSLEVQEHFAEETPSTLWPDGQSFQRFTERHQDSYAACDAAPPPPPGVPSTVWTEAMHRAANEAFAAWERANRERLRRRAAQGLAFFEPDR